MTRDEDLEAAYIEAWAEWFKSGEADVWDVVVGDGLDDFPAS